ncbi:hypothetical protein B0J11DRAFT_610328 [Dendryphion nanum]|uniref:Uncharacterized protein n=1 Tax=Dendryphion nanum TaxID=256645 RepID=A0A9P9EL17_9PLEO|nr:hypothetical protein B0J11DRAFT_610328 [Dendryphion nanum]
MASSVVIPASFLFGPKEMKLFQRWQTEEHQIPEYRRDELPTALEFEAYMAWRQRDRNPQLERISGVSRETALSAVDDSAQADQGSENDSTRVKAILRATKCKHSLHPTHPIVLTAVDPTTTISGGGQFDEGEDHRLPYCPVCTIKVHLKYLTILQDKWKYHGGPWYHANNLQASNKNDYLLGTRAYHRAKVELLTVVYDVEDWADAEVKWEAEQSDEQVDNETAKHSATAALSLYRKEYKYPSTISISSNDGGLEPTHALVSMLDVSTAPPDDTSSKFVSFRSPDTCIDAEDWHDTSFYNDYFYTLSQSRILYCTWSADLGGIMYRDLNIGDTYGDNEHILHLQKLITEELGQLSPNSLFESEKELSSSSHIYLVWMENENGMVNDADGSDVQLFNNFRAYPTLIGTPVEEYAKILGDIEKDSNVTDKGGAEYGGDGPGDLVPDTDAEMEDPYDDELDPERVTEKEDLDVNAVEPAFEWAGEMEGS